MAQYPLIENIFQLAQGKEQEFIQELIELENDPKVKLLLQGIVNDKQKCKNFVEGLQKRAECKHIIKKVPVKNTPCHSRKSGNSSC